MTILLDEYLPLDCRHSFPQHEAHTVEWAGLKGKKYGELLREAERAGYVVMLTVDQAISRQQRIPAKLCIILIRARTNDSEDLLPLVEGISQAIERVQPRKTIPVPNSPALISLAAWLSKRIYELGIY